MTDHEKPLSDTELDALFADMRQSTPEPNAAFLAQIAATAEQVRLGADPEPRAPARPRNRTAGTWHKATDLLSKARGARIVWPAGLSAAALAGLWIGAVSGGGLAAQGSTLLQTELSYDLAYWFPQIAGLAGGL